MCGKAASRPVPTLSQEKRSNPGDTGGDARGSLGGRGGHETPPDLAGGRYLNHQVSQSPSRVVSKKPSLWDVARPGAAAPQVSCRISTSLAPALHLQPETLASNVWALPGLQLTYTRRHV